MTERKEVFSEEEIAKNDLYFLCYMIERVAGNLHQRNRYVANSVGKSERNRLIILANMLNCENYLRVLLWSGKILKLM